MDTCRGCVSFHLLRQHAAAINLPQVILIQREGCMECWRERNSSPSGAQVGFRGPGAAPRQLLVPWEDIWGPELFSPDGVEATERVPQRVECGHSPSKARSYYDPHGDDGEYWLVLMGKGT